MGKDTLFYTNQRKAGVAMLMSKKTSEQRILSGT